jgi:leucyl/phenylalanyl-tRNA---protein transferase
MTPGNYQQGSNKLYWVKDNQLATDFPDVKAALRDPDGLLAIGGDLSEKRLLNAYQNGIFPWYNEGQPILWWSPDPRCILEPHEIKISRSLAKRLRKDQFKVTFNAAFPEVIEACAGTRKGINDTWITNDIKLAYLNLFKQGYAHSVECWQESRLVGGLYGIAMGKIFFGESMFSHVSDASKVAFVKLAQNLDKMNFRLIDCQVHSPHLQSLGAKPIHRDLFIQMLENYCNFEKIVSWQQEISS